MTEKCGTIHTVHEMEIIYHYSLTCVSLYHYVSEEHEDHVDDITQPPCFCEGTGR